jgi:hypothetical protein
MILAEMPFLVMDWKIGQTPTFMDTWKKNALACLVVILSAYVFVLRAQTLFATAR